MLRFIPVLASLMVLAHQASAQSETCVQIGTQCQKPSDRSLSISSAADLADLGAVAQAPWITLLAISRSDDFQDEIDLSAIAKLPQLELLSLEDFQNFDASALQSTSLRTLSIANGQPASYDFLASLDGLEKLQLNRALDAIANLPLRELPSLKQLNVINSAMTSLEGIELLQNLEGIALTNTDVVDLGPLASLNLKRVTLVSDKIGDLAPLGSSAEITHLRIGGPTIVSLDGLSLGPSLEQIDGSNSGLRDISALDAATDVKRVILKGANIDDVAALRGKSQLEQLDLRENPLADLSPLVDLTNLTTLDLSDTMIADLSPLAKLTSVESISLSRIPAEDISPLIGMESVKVLWLNETRADDLSPLLDMPSLKAFVVDDQKKLSKTTLPSYLETRVGFSE
ncbi:MAG: leucine-rich repeat domain-containing protein [Paracoccaceae bacterium]